MTRRTTLAALLALALTACGSGGFQLGATHAGSALGRSTSGAERALVINEIMATPVHARTGEYVELFNTGRKPAQVAGLIIDDGDSTDTLVLRSGTDRVAPGGYALLVDPDDHGGIPVPAGVPVYTTDDHALGNGLAESDPVILREPDGTIIDAVRTHQRTSSGQARERRAPRLPDVAASWRIVDGGSPGRRNELAPSDHLKIHFTDPQSDGTTVAALVAFIDRAHTTLDCALYQLDHPGVIDAFVAAAGRGVTVRIITDSTFYDRADYQPGYQRLENAGILVVPDERSSESHNKYLVADGLHVWLGSYNPTVNPSADAAVELDDPAIAADLIQGVDDMAARHFGVSKQKTRTPDATVDGAPVELLVSPVDGVEDHIIQIVSQAQHSIHFAAFTLTQAPLAATIEDRAAHGVEVRGAVDWLHATIRGSQWKPMVAAGLDVRRTPHDELMHHKMIILDAGTKDATLIVGSYNFTGRAETRNDETLLVIRDPRIVAAAEGDFATVWSHSVLPDGAAPDVRVRLSEIAGGADPWVELDNTGTVDAHTGGLVVTDLAGSVSLPDVTLAPGAHAVVVLGGKAPHGIAAGATVIYAARIEGGLGVSDPVLLENASGDALDGVAPRELVDGTATTLSRSGPVDWIAGAPTPGR